MLVDCIRPSAIRFLASLDAQMPHYAETKEAGADSKEEGSTLLSVEASSVR
jgi:hypothetical protein